MIDNEKWLNTLNNAKKNTDKIENQLDPDKWIDTLPKSKKQNSIKKYSLTATIFIIGLIFVSVIKNETRGLQKEIFNLHASINKIKLDLHNASLDHEVITSPGNISKLAKKHLETELFIYEKSQIKNINQVERDISKANKKENKVKKLSKKVKTKIEDEIKVKKNELKKLQVIAKNPGELPGEIKLQIVKKIETKKEEIKNLYNNPQTWITPDRVQRWAGVQLVKAFLGIPIIPGK